MKKGGGGWIWKLLESFIKLIGVLFVLFQGDEGWGCISQAHLTRRS